MYSKDDFKKFEKMAIEVAEKCAGLIIEKSNNFEHFGEIELKSSFTDPVTEIDKASETLARNTIKNFDSNFKIWGEEFGLDSIEEDDIFWLIDPIDGTVNFIYGLPAFAVSIAVCLGKKVVAAAVYNVYEKKLYAASLNNGAYIKDLTGIKHLKTSKTELELSKSLFATGFAYKKETRIQQVEILTSVLPEIRDIRRIGAASLDICLVAENKLDGYYEHGLGPWDFAAASLIASEAGFDVHVPSFYKNYADKELTYVVHPSLKKSFLEKLNIPVKLIN